MAGRASVELHTLIFFKDQEVVADARVTRVSASFWLSEHCSHTHALPKISPRPPELGQSPYRSPRQSVGLGGWPSLCSHGRLCHAGRSCSLWQLWRPDLG